LIVELSIGLAIAIGVFIAIGLKANEAEWGFWLTNVIDGWIRIFCRRYHRQSGDQINLPQQGGVVLVANHISGLDPFILITATKRPLRFLIALEEYNRFGLTWLFKLAGCIPVDRSGRVDKAFRFALRAVNSGEVVALFPHGKIYLDHEERKAIKPGLRKLVEKLKCDVYMARVTGASVPGEVFSAVIKRGDINLQHFGSLDHSRFEDSDINQRIGSLLLGSLPYNHFHQDIDLSQSDYVERSSTS
jgi:1-acyl-sn-glycerol-3-phosphate acyltransferase